MRFVHPSFLFFLLFALVPIILYFFNLQKVIRVDFSGVEFLEDLKKKTSKRFEAKRLLILLFRVLAIIFIVLAFAQPNFKSEDSGFKHHIVFLDNSLSMTRKVEADQLLDKAKMVIASSLKSKKGDKFSLLTLDNWKINEDFYSEKEFLKALSKVEATSNSVTAQQIAALLRRKKTDLEKKYYFVSDFQSSVYSLKEIENVLSDSTDFLVLGQLEANNENDFIDSVWLDSRYIVAGNQTRLNFSVQNRGEKTKDVLLRTTIDGNQLASKAIKVDANSKENSFIDVQLPKAGFNDINLSLEESNVTFDKNYHVVLDANKNVKVLIIKGSDKSFVEKTYQNEALFLVKSYEENRVNTSEILQFDLIILDGLKNIKTSPINQLKEFVKKGGQIFLLPNESDTSTDLEYFAQQLGFSILVRKDVSTEQEQVDFSELSKNEWFNKDFVASNQKVQAVNFDSKFDFQNVEKLIQSRKGNAFLSVKTAPNGAKLYVLSCPLSKQSTNFMEHALFVVTNYEMAMHSAASNQNIAFEISDQTIVLKNLDLDKAKQYTLQGEFGQYVPEQQIIGNDLHIKLTENEKPGFYNLMSEGKVFSKIGINSNRKESYFEPLDLSSLNNSDNIEVQTWDASQANLAESGEIGFGKWKWWVLLALLCLLAETALIRFYK